MCLKLTPMQSAFVAKIFDYCKSRRTFALFIALWCFSLVGIQSVPIEEHESFVLVTSRQMKEDGDWLLPRYNNEVRLNKPPLNYWATILVSKLDPRTQDIQIYHGRLVSLVGILLMVLLTARTGEKLYGRETGVLAALFLLCSKGILDFSCNAKPDVLYAALCTLQLFAWLDAWQANDKNRQRGMALLGWGAAGLATLSKGPQVPVIFLAGFCGFLAWGSERRRILSVLRPWGGLALFALLVVPWWVLLHQRLNAMGVNLSDSQLSGSLLHPAWKWNQLLRFYYVWLPLDQMLPVSLLLLFVIPPFLKQKEPLPPASRLFVCVSVVMLALFTFGPQYRKHYVLPLLPVFSLLVAERMRYVRLPVFRQSAIIGRGVSVALAAATALCMLGCAGVLLWNRAYPLLAVFVVVCALTAVLLKAELTAPEGSYSAFTKFVSVIACAVAVFGSFCYDYVPTLQWSAAEQQFKQRVGEQLPGNARLICWKTTPNILPLFVHHPVLAFSEPDKLANYVSEHLKVHPIFAVLPQQDLPSLNAAVKTRVLQSITNKKKAKESLCCVEILGVAQDAVKP